MLKDGYDAVEMNTTTGGCLDLADSKPLADAPPITAFKSAGAIILGDTNLHELALGGLSVLSLGSQTINPYDHSRTPGRNSSGTGVVIATSFGSSEQVYRYQTIINITIADPFSGTDTVNSLWVVTSVRERSFQL